MLRILRATTTKTNKPTTSPRDQIATRHQRVDCQDPTFGTTGPNEQEGTMHHQIDGKAKRKIS